MNSAYDNDAECGGQCYQCERADWSCFHTASSCDVGPGRHLCPSCDPGRPAGRNDDADVAQPVEADGFKPVK